MPEEEIIILETDDEEEDSSPPKKEQEQEAQEKLEDKKKKLVILGSIVGVVLLVIIIVIVLFLKNSQENANIVDINTTELAKKINKRDNIPQFSPSRLENMIKKANLLYERGNKEEALKIYKKIATFNEAISYYNIGVAKIKEKNYKGAIEAFKKAISNGEQRCVSAINAGVAALELKNYDLFKYYIDLAYSYLPLENNSPLYSYYMGLINYYKKYYYESLASFRHPSSKFYNYEQKYLSSKILASFDLNYKAVSNLESIAKVDDALTLGLLYARLGEFKVAKNYLTKAIQNTQNPLHVKASLALVENKLGNLKTSADLMNEIYKQYKDKALKVLKEPCEVKLISDSRYVVQSINQWLDNWVKNNWKTASKKPVKNQDLWQQYLKVAKQHKIKAIWIKAHNGHIENERCDMLAKNFALKLSKK